MPIECPGKRRKPFLRWKRPPFRGLPGTTPRLHQPLDVTEARVTRVTADHLAAARAGPRARRKTLRNLNSRRSRERGRFQISRLSTMRTGDRRKEPPNKINQPQKRRRCGSPGRRLTAPAKKRDPSRTCRASTRARLRCLICRSKHLARRTRKPWPFPRPRRRRRNSVIWTSSPRRDCLRWPLAT